MISGEDTKSGGAFSLKALLLLSVLAVLALLLGACADSGRDRQGQGAESGIRTEPIASDAGQASQAKDTGLDRLYRQGCEYYDQRRYKDAVAVMDQVIDGDPGFYQAYTIKGIALCFDGRFDDGMREIDRALELKPDYGGARFNKALAYELYAHYDLALDWYDRTIGVEPDSVWSYYGKASIYGRRGDVAATVENLKRAIDLNPGVKKDAREEKDFNNVRNSPEFQKLVSE